MKIGIANDHWGVMLKQSIMLYLLENGYEVINYGTDTDDNVNYTDYAIKLGEAINKGDVEFGIAICGTGVGISIAMNKIKNMRCAKVNNLEEVKQSRMHINCNVMAFASSTNLELAKEMVLAFINTEFVSEKRYLHRIEKLKEMDNVKV